jgi:hypothetical protein
MEEKINIIKGNTYRIKGNSKYFTEKYGTPNPLIVIEDEDEKVFGGWWGFQRENPACVLYGIRSGLEELPPMGKVYYGHIDSLGELVHETELEEIIK